MPRSYWDLRAQLRELSGDRENTSLPAGVRGAQIHSQVTPTEASVEPGMPATHKTAASLILTPIFSGKTRDQRKLNLPLCPGVPLAPSPGSILQPAAPHRTLLTVLRVVRNFLGGPVRVELT